jgi:lipopolysaccharide heptosyltransferase II
VKQGGWARARRILAVRLDAMGDLLMTTPALRALKSSAPDAHITLLASPAGATVARLVPDIDDVIVYEAPWVKATAARASSGADLAMVERLRAGRFDAAVIFTVYSQNPLPAALLCWLADIPLRLGHCHENPYRLLTDWVHDPEPASGVRHEVRRQLDLVATVGAQTRDERLSLDVPSAALAGMHDRLRRRGVEPAGAWVLMHPGASAASRRYPTESFAAVTRALLTRGIPVVTTVGPDEHDLLTDITWRLTGEQVTIVADLGLEDLAALTALAGVLVSNNSGPVHIAAAVGTPVVDLYALTNPQHTPWQVPHRVLFHDVPCKYCYRSVCPEGHHACLRQVPPESVVAATLELLAEVGDGRASVPSRV